jgi:hypothetical protein
MNDVELTPIIEEALRELEGLPLEEEMVEIVPEEIMEVADIEGLTEEDLGAIRRLFPFYGKLWKRRLRRLPRFRRWVGRTIKKVRTRLPAIGEMSIWYHGKQPADNSTIEYFSTKASGDRYNFKKDGIQPDEDVVITGISAFFEPRVTNTTDIDNILSKMMQADVMLKIGDEEKLKVPLSYIIDFIPVVGLDGSTAAIDKIYMANTKLEKGIFKLDNIHYPAKKTLQITVDFRDTFSNSTYWLYFAIEHKKK